MNDAQYISAEVEKRKKRASDLDLPDTVYGLFGLIRHYPAWLKKCPQYCVDAVEEPTEIFRNAVEFTYKGSRFRLSSTDHHCTYPDGETDHWQMIAVDANQRRVFELRVSVEYDDYGSTSKPSAVEGFIEADWVESLRNLYQLVRTRHDEQIEIARRQREIEKAQQLKDKFGIT